MPRALWWSLGVELFLMSEVTQYARRVKVQLAPCSKVAKSGHLQDDFRVGRRFFSAGRKKTPRVDLSKVALCTRVPRS